MPQGVAAHRAVVERAARARGRRDRRARLQQRVPGRRAREAHGGVGRESPAEGGGPHHLPAVTVQCDLHDGDAVRRLRLADLFRGDRLQAALVQQALVRVLVVDAQQAAVRAVRALRQREEVQPVRVHAHLRGLVVGAAGRARIPARPPRDGIAPGRDHVVRVAVGQQHPIFLRDRDRAETEARRALREHRLRSADERDRRRAERPLQDLPAGQGHLDHRAQLFVRRRIADGVVFQLQLHETSRISARPSEAEAEDDRATDALRASVGIEGRVALVGRRVLRVGRRLAAIRRCGPGRRRLAARLDVGIRGRVLLGNDGGIGGIAGRWLGRGGHRDQRLRTGPPARRERKKIPY